VIHVESCTFQGNVARTTEGGGLAVVLPTDPAGNKHATDQNCPSPEYYREWNHSTFVNVVASTFENNSAGGGGGGLFFLGGGSVRM
jgi:hypothetical protein